MSFLDTLRRIAEADGVAVRVGWTDPEVARIQAINETKTLAALVAATRVVLLADLG